MKITNYIFILLLLGSGYLYSQSISDSDKIFIDSLRTANITVFIIDEYCTGCGKTVGERKPVNQALSCSYIDEYQIIWHDKDNKLINTKITNSCYELLCVNSYENNIYDNLNFLFKRLLNDSTKFDIWIEPAHFDSTNQLPIMGSSFYKISKLDGFQELSINFNEYLFINNSEIENTKAIEFLLNKILYGFNKENARLLNEGAKININWH